MKKLIVGLFAASVMTAGLVTVSGSTSANAADYPPAPPVATVGSVTASPTHVKPPKKKNKKKSTLTVVAGATSVKSVVGTILVTVTPNDGKGFLETKVFPNVTTGSSVVWTSGLWPKKKSAKYKKYKGTYTVTETFTPADPAIATPSAPVTASFRFK